MDGHEIANGFLGSWPTILFLVAVVVVGIAIISEKMKNDD